MKHKKEGHNVKILILPELQDRFREKTEFYGLGECAECHKPRLPNHEAEYLDYQGPLLPDLRLEAVRVCAAS